jgi:hypothetical protein
MQEAGFERRRRLLGNGSQTVTNQVQRPAPAGVQRVPAEWRKMPQVFDCRPQSATPTAAIDSAAASGARTITSRKPPTSPNLAIAQPASKFAGPEDLLMPSFRAK